MSITEKAKYANKGSGLKIGKPTKITDFIHEQDRIRVRIWNKKTGFWWQLEVNGSKSQVYSYYPGILEHKGYCITSAYWGGTFPEFVPFKISTAQFYVKSA